MMFGDALVLFLTAIAHEDVAIVTAVYLILERDMPPAVALAAIYGGTLVGNLTVYAVGAAAHRGRWFQHWHVSERVARVRDRVSHHWAVTLLLCRLTPGLLWPTLLGCGWLGIRFARFAVVCAVAAALYVIPVLALAVALGEALPRARGVWPWVALTALALTTGALGMWWWRRRKRPAR